VVCVCLLFYTIETHFYSSKLSLSAFYIPHLLKFISSVKDALHALTFLGGKIARNYFLLPGCTTLAVNLSS